MQVKPGDRVAVETEHVDEPEREGEVLENIQGSTSGTYWVRWRHGRETLFTPAAGPCASSRRADHRSRLGSRSDGGCYTYRRGRRAERRA